MTERGWRPCRVFLRSDDTLGQGPWVTCELHKRPMEITTCLSCRHYKGVLFGDTQPCRVKCSYQLAEQASRDVAFTICPIRPRHCLQ